MTDSSSLEILVRISTFIINTINIIKQIYPVSGRPASKKNNGEKSNRERRIRKEEIEYYKRKEERDKELQKFQERIELRSLEFQSKKLELEKEEAEDRRKINALYRELLREMQQNDIEIKLKEIQANWDKDYWISKLSRDETKEILQKYGEFLLILISPLGIAKDNSLASFRNLDFDLEMRRVGDFFEKYYSPQDKLHTVKFFSDYFKEPIGKIDVDRLHRVLAPISTYIFYTDITVDAVTFRVGHWRLLNTEVSQFPAIEWNWKEAKQELIIQGKTEEEALEIIRKIIIEIHKLLAAFYADLYFLSLNLDYEPKLFKLESEFRVNLLEPFIKEINDIQQEAIESYENHINNIIIEEEKSLYELGIESFNQGEYQTAIENFNCLIEINPDLADSYYYRGLSYANLGDFQKTIEDYIQLAKLNPSIETYRDVLTLIETKYPENTAFYILEFAIISIRCESIDIANYLIYQSVKLYLKYLNYHQADEIKDDIDEAIDIIFNLLMSEPQLYNKEYLEKLRDCLAGIGDIEASSKVDKALSLLEESL